MSWQVSKHSPPVWIVQASAKDSLATSISYKLVWHPHAMTTLLAQNSPKTRLVGTVPTWTRRHVDIPQRLQRVCFVLIGRPDKSVTVWAPQSIMALCHERVIVFVRKRRLYFLCHSKAPAHHDASTWRQHGFCEFFTIAQNILYTPIWGAQVIGQCQFNEM